MCFLISKHVFEFATDMADLNKMNELMVLYTVGLTVVSICAIFIIIIIIRFALQTSKYFGITECCNNKLICVSIFIMMVSLCHVCIFWYRLFTPFATIHENAKLLPRKHHQSIHNSPTLCSHIACLWWYINRKQNTLCSSATISTCTSKRKTLRIAKVRSCQYK